ncbi:hypothetical protein CcaverHIS631_0603340 [Cutaneotrichosporon cavernicola]|nr:hypothetical protein CcaverHIS631_0603340 [Cutaneotrichosporon cavernicola]
MTEIKLTEEHQEHRYPGHPELELAMLRRYERTQDLAHLAFAHYLLSARGQAREDQNGLLYFEYDAGVREDPVYPETMEAIWDVGYHQSHKPIVEQDDILSHSVRDLYLQTGAADAGGELQSAARRLFDVTVRDTMNVPAGFGSEPRTEVFSRHAHHLPQSTAEGGCYAETCASFTSMMTAERLQFRPDGGLATSGDEAETRKDWFEVCCCSPNLSPALGMLGGHPWRAPVDAQAKRISLDVYLFLSGTRNIDVGGVTATATMSTSMPGKGETRLTLSGQVPSQEYAADIKCFIPAEAEDGFLRASAPGKVDVAFSFTMPVRLVAPQLATWQAGNAAVTRGPIVYVAESVDNAALDEAHPHFEGVGLYPTASFTEKQIEIEGVSIIALATWCAAVLKQYVTGTP